MQLQAAVEDKRAASDQPAIDYAEVLNEIKQTAFNSLLIATSGIFLGWYLLSHLSLGLGDVVYVSYVILVGGAFTGAAYLLRKRSPTLANLLWLGGLFLAVILAIALFQRLELAYFFSLFPLLAVAVSFRWQWGIATELLLGVILLLVEPQLVQVGPLPFFSLQDFIVLLLGCVALVIGGTFAQGLLSLTGWSMTNYRKERAELEHMRNERVHLLQVQEDFTLANKELARLTERLAAMTQVAEEARRIKEDFVARVSHELRTPLNMVIGFSEVIMKSPQLYGDSIPSALLADVDAILRNSQHLSRLVDDILDLSQVEAGRMALTKEWMSVPDVVGEAVMVVKGLFDSKGLYLREVLPANLPPLFADSTRIRQVIINLLGNAGRFTEAGGVTVGVELRGKGESSQLVFGVTDTGPGISPENQHRVFEPFHQVDSVLRQHKGGTGLGLTISKQFVEMHGGSMWLESEPGKGTSFFFSLPMQAQNLELEEDAQRWFNPYFQYDQRTRLANLPKPEFTPRYVLVESEDSLRRLFSRYADNVEVVTVKHVEEAVSEVRRSPAQALIFNDPGHLEDAETQAKLGGLPFGTPVISCWLPGKEEAARRLGVVEYLIKPAARDDLLSALAKVPEARRVLLVDDEPEILRLFVRMLSAVDRPYQLVQAMNGKRALQLLRSRKPDVMILDLVMPEMDGFEVLNEKSQDPEIRDIPVIVVSSLNPQGESSVSRSIAVSRGNGLSAHELLNCIQALTAILVPVERNAHPESAKTPAAKPAS